MATDPRRASTERMDTGEYATAVTASAANVCLPDGALINRPYGELAAALYASDMPAREQEGEPWTNAQLVAWVRQGIDRLGGDQGVWHADHRSRQARLDGDWRTYDRLWPDHSREELALSLANRIVKDPSYAYMPTLQLMLIAVWDDGSQWFRQVDARDAHFAAGLGVTL